MHAPFNLIKNISPRRPTRGTTNLALQFHSCPLDATSTLRDGAHSMVLYEDSFTSVRGLSGGSVTLHPVALMPYRPWRAQSGSPYMA
jgi:hypothetical protein